MEKKRSVRKESEHGGAIKRIRKRKNSIARQNNKGSFYAKEERLRKLFIPNSQCLYFCKRRLISVVTILIKVYFNVRNFNPNFLVLLNLFCKNFTERFLDEVLNVLSPLSKIEHQIDFIQKQQFLIGQCIRALPRG